MRRARGEIEDSQLFEMQPSWLFSEAAARIVSLSTLALCVEDLYLGWCTESVLLVYTFRALCLPAHCEESSTPLICVDWHKRQLASCWNSNEPRATLNIGGSENQGMGGLQPSIWIKERVEKREILGKCHLLSRRLHKVLSKWFSDGN